MGMERFDRHGPGEAEAEPRGDGLLALTSGPGLPLSFSRKFTLCSNSFTVLSMISTVLRAWMAFASTHVRGAAGSSGTDHTQNSIYDRNEETVCPFLSDLGKRPHGLCRRLGPSAVHM